MATQLERLVTLEESRKWQWLFLCVATLAAAGWLGYLTIRLNTILESQTKLGERIAHLEGEKGDALGAMLKGITAPPSQAALTANLDVLSAELHRDKTTGSSPKPRNLNELSAAVEKASVKNAELPEIWRVAGELVTARYSPTRPEDATRNCFVLKHYQKSLTDRTPDVQSGPLLFRHFTKYEDCTLHIDDVEGFSKSSSMELVQKSLTQVPNVTSTEIRHFILVRNVRVIYSGRQLIQADFQFEGCTFELELPTSVPPPAGQKLTRQLLIADNRTPITFLSN